ncbi:MAG: hypothetical protein ABF298_03180, partial [Alteriqipengyuania sp.]
MRLLFPLTLAAILVASVPAGAQERQQFGDNLFLENVPQSVLYDGREVAGHMRTQNSYSVRGWTHDGDALLFSYRGDLYRRSSVKGDYVKLLDLPGLSLSNAKPASVCGRNGYVFTSDRDGDEYSAVYLTDGRSFDADKVSPGRSRNVSVIVSDTGDQIAYASAEAGTGVWQLIVQPGCADRPPQVLARGNAPFYPDDFSPDGRYLLAEGPADDGFKLSEIDLETGEETVLVEADEDVKDSAYSAVGRYVFFTSNAYSDFTDLLRFDRVTGEWIP